MVDITKEKISALQEFLGKGLNNGGKMTDKIDLIKVFLGAVRGEITQKGADDNREKVNLMDLSTVILDKLVEENLTEENLKILCKALLLCQRHKNAVENNCDYILRVNSSLTTKGDREKRGLNKIEDRARLLLSRTSNDEEYLATIKGTPGKELVNLNIRMVKLGSNVLEKFEELMKKLEIFISPSRDVASRKGATASTAPVVDPRGGGGSAGAGSGAGSHTAPSPAVVSDDKIPELVPLNEVTFQAACEARGERSAVAALAARRAAEASSRSTGTSGL